MSPSENDDMSVTQCASQPLFALSSGGRPMEHVSHYYWTQLSHESDNQRCLCMLVFMES